MKQTNIIDSKVFTSILFISALLCFPVSGLIARTLFKYSTPENGIKINSVFIHIVALQEMLTLNVSNDEMTIKCSITYH